MSEAAIAFYASHADALRAAWAGIAPDVQLAPVADHLPKRASRILDIGAGIGTLATWFAEGGHDVTAVEPVAAFHGAQGPRWVAAALPGLEGIEGGFDLALCIGVWQHVPPEQREAAMVRMAGCLCSEGQLILALRHGPVPDKRPNWATSTDETLALAARAGVRAEAVIGAGAIQPGNRAAGVRFDWLVLRKGR